MTQVIDPDKGTWVLMVFIAFFGLIIVVNTIFIYNALNSHSGVVMENPYYKGLAYNKTLDAAANQPNIKQSAVFEDGILYWNISDENGAPIDAKVRAKIIRIIKDGDDFEVTLDQYKNGKYKAALDLPMKGRWSAQLKATWNTSQYQTRLLFIAK